MEGKHSRANLGRKRFFKKSFEPHPAPLQGRWKRAAV
jgi:hypothetical protein